jgi:hypothetical protein
MGEGGGTMRVIRTKRHRKVVTLAWAERVLDQVKERVLDPNGPQDVDIEVEAARSRLRKHLLYAQEFEVPEDRDLYKDPI